MVYLFSEGALLKHLSELQKLDICVGGFGDGIESELCTSNVGTPASGNFASLILTTV
jgi:hypothetical protein